MLTAVLQWQFGMGRDGEGGLKELVRGLCGGCVGVGWRFRSVGETRYCRKEMKLFVYLQVTRYGVAEVANSLAFAHARVADSAAAVDAVGCWTTLAEGA